MLSASRAHAFLLHGPTGVGKTTLARAAAAQLLECDVADLERHPNVVMLRSEIDDKTGEQKAVIGVEPAERFRDALLQSAVGGGVKVGIIERADLLNPQAQNSLLKLVEEPRGRTVFFFIATDVTRLLPTLQSRMIAIPFVQLSDAEYALLRERHPISDEDAVEKNTVAALATSLTTGEKITRLLAAQNIAKGDDAQSRQTLALVAAAVAKNVHNTFVQKCGTMSLRDRRDYATALTLLCDAETALREYANPALVFESIVLALP